jgi:hypothetical protein
MSSRLPVNFRDGAWTSGIDYQDDAELYEDHADHQGLKWDGYWKQACGYWRWGLELLVKVESC